MCETIENPNGDLKSEWNRFKTSDQYYKYFMTKEEHWNIKFEELKRFMKQSNGTLPSTSHYSDVYPWMKKQQIFF